MGKLRPALKTKDLGIGQVLRIETFRTKTVWWKRIWKPKYDTRYYAITKEAIYDITEFLDTPKERK